MAGRSVAPKPRAAHVYVSGSQGRAWVEIFSAEDIASRFAAARIRALRRQGLEAKRFDFRAGGANDPTLLAVAIRLVAKDQEKAFPDWSPAQVVEDARNTLVLHRHQWNPGASVLEGDPEDPTFKAYRRLLRASDGAVEAALRLVADRDFPV